MPSPQFLGPVASSQFPSLSPGLLEGMGVWKPVGTCVVTEVMTVIAASSSSPRYASDLEQARPQTSGEEELQLQLALAMSREEAEKVRLPQLGRGRIETELEEKEVPGCSTPCLLGSPTVGPKALVLLPRTAQGLSVSRGLSQQGPPVASSPLWLGLERTASVY